MSYTDAGDQLDPDSAPNLTPKALRTRQQIVDTALDLFAEQGYDATTMRDIAAATGYSLGLTYRYFAQKEDLVLALYRQMAEATRDQIESLPAAPLADRFHAVMQQRLSTARPYRDALGALFGATMNAQSRSSLLGDDAADMRYRTQQAFVDLVAGASDAPLTHAQRDSVATLLYSLHFALILFWLIDHSEGQQRTVDLLDVIRNGLARYRPLLLLPFVNQGLARLAEIAAAVFVR